MPWSQQVGGGGSQLPRMSQLSWGGDRRVLCAAYKLPSPLCARGQRHQHSLLGNLRDTDGTAELVRHPPVVPLAVPPCHPAGEHLWGKTPLKGRMVQAGSHVSLVGFIGPLLSLPASGQAAVRGENSSTDGDNVGVSLLRS